MQDISSISKALHEVVNSAGKLPRPLFHGITAEQIAPDEEKLTSTIERFLISNDPAVRVAAVKTLAGILDEIKASDIPDEDKEAKLVS